MTHDESLYPDPYTFKPERFFDNNGELNCDDRVLAYGFGRRFSSSKFASIEFAYTAFCRVCVGRHVASSTVRSLFDLRVFAAEWYTPTTSSGWWSYLF